MNKKHENAITNAITNATTEANKVRAAAEAMIETPLDLIPRVLLRHEQSEIEIMRELETERHRHRLRDALRCCLDVASRRMLNPDEIRHWQALLGED